jgi:hypothetical protein
MTRYTRIKHEVETESVNNLGINMSLLAPRACNRMYYYLLNICWKFESEEQTEVLCLGVCHMQF